MLGSVPGRQTSWDSWSMLQTSCYRTSDSDSNSNGDSNGDLGLATAAAPATATAMAKAAVGHLAGFVISIVYPHVAKGG